MHRFLILYCALTFSAFAGDLQLTLPPVVYATPDVPISIYSVLQNRFPKLG